MLDELLRIASTQGLWATLAVVLIFYNLRNQEKHDKRQNERECRYQDLINRLAYQMNEMQEIKHLIEETKESIEML